ncbi:MAG TPA: hypothetical protein VLZ75_01720 [Chitinophagales bacterium]|nr:hypothetical protein [Chitinophagales bacterium]
MSENSIKYLTSKEEKKQSFRLSEINQQLSILNKPTKIDVDQIDNSYIHPSQMYIIVVGDKATVLEPLKKLGYPIIEMDIDNLGK